MHPLFLGLKIWMKSVCYMQIITLRKEKKLLHLMQRLICHKTQPTISYACPQVIEW